MKLTTSAAAVMAVLALTLTACTDDDSSCAETTLPSDGVVNTLTLPDLAEGRSSGGGGSRSGSSGSSGGSSGGLTKNNSSSGTTAAGGSTGGSGKHKHKHRKIDDDLFEGDNDDATIDGCGG